MNISEILSGKRTTIEIDEEVVISKEFYQDSEIIELSSIKIKGKISSYDEDNLELDITYSGTMTIPDAISLEAVKYDFSSEISENVQEKLKKDENMLDIINILWENIVLEVPIRYTLVEDYESYQGDGWRLVSEDEKENNNPFKELLAEIEEE